MSVTAAGSSKLLGKELGGVFFLYGHDQFRKEEEAKALVAAHLDPGTRDFNFDPLRGTEVSVEDLASILATPPMMAEWRVVRLREVQALAGNSRAREVLLDVVANPPPGLALVLSASIPKGSSAKFYRELKKLARSAEFPEVGPNDVPGWIIEWAQTRHGREVTPDAARALAAGVGTDLGVLAQEVRKLTDLVEGTEPVDLAAVEAAGTRIPIEDPWRWMDRVGNREFDDALNGLRVLFTQGESGVRLTMGLATHLIRLALVRTGGAGALQSTLPNHQKWLASRLQNQARRWTLKELDSAILGLRRVDRLLKSSTLSDDRVLEEWILGLVTREEMART
jgi:DNA polymerase III delta subunit